MNKNNNKKVQADTASTIEQLLDDNPNIFIDYPNLITRVNLPDLRGTSSLLELQIKRLREQFRSSETRYRSLIHIAKDNQTIVDKLSHVSDVLIATRSFDQMLRDLENLFKSLFDVCELSCKLEADQNSTKEDYQETVRRITQRRAVCDNRFPSKVLDYLFDNPVKSAAIVPLYVGQQEQAIGILALGSANENRYTQDLGTAHLDRLGSMVAHCVNRLRLQT
jgi:uncharacterized protein YigA (DUF484 family)